jgi:small conductance mechanosensitive channel
LLLLMPRLASAQDLVVEAAAVDAIEAVEPLPDPSAVPDDVEPDELKLMLRPLTAEEIEPVAGSWVERLQAKVEDVSRARLAAAHADGAEKAELSATAAELALERDALISRLEVILSALEGKGGDVESTRQYADAVAAIDVNPLDVEALWNEVKTWLLSTDGGLAVGLNIIYFLLILFLAMIVAGILRRITKRALSRVRGASTLLKNFLAGLVYKIMLIVGVVVAISFLGVNIAPLVAAIGAAGLVVGLALQGTLSNFASGIMILLYRPYDVGDVINVAGGVVGKVDAMSLVSTTVITPDNQKIIIPNNSIWGDTITNMTGLPTRRVDMNFSVGYGDDLNYVMSVLADVCREHEKVLDDPEPLIKVTSHGDSSVTVTCRPWVNTEDYWGVFWDFHKLVKQRFDEKGISIPFPQRDVHMISEAA